MRSDLLRMLLAVWLSGATLLRAAMTPEQVAQLPPSAAHRIDFSAEIKPILEGSCIKCHGRGKDKGGFRIDTRETFLKGGDSGPVVVSGKSDRSLLIELVQGFDPDNLMPKKGSRLGPNQVGLLRAWIDQGLRWDDGISFARLPPNNLEPRSPPMPPGPKSANPIDRFLAPYFVRHQVKPLKVVGDAVFARRAYLDVTGLLPPPKELKAFESERGALKRERLVRRLLADNRDYAEHWLTFWNDLLRNDYKGTGYIDGGRKQITKWLYSALLTNMPYDQFVAQLVNPGTNSEGFTKGIVWRGVVNASQTPQMQAAQNISQVFMGVNLKCASCHDSFVNDLTLADAYGLAGIFADEPLEMVHCDKPTGKRADLKFLYPELGAIEPGLDKPARLRRLAEVITSRQDARLTRTLVNRIWQRFMGHGLVEPVDDLEKTAWAPELLDWLAEDFAVHDYDIKHLMERILTSKAYQMPSVNPAPPAQADYVFRGPEVRRLSAEQFRDALTSLTGVGYASPAVEVNPSEPDQKRFAPPGTVNWVWNDRLAAEQTRPGHLYFRKTFTLKSVPEDATAVILCDNGFTLFVNGREVGTGSDFTQIFLFDLRPYLTPGVNLIAVDAVNNLRDNSPPSSTNDFPANSYNPAGLLFYARLRAMVGGQERRDDFVSDPTWLVSEAKEDQWEQAGFAPINWRPAVKLGDMGMPPWRVNKEHVTARLASLRAGKVRASLVTADPLLRALGRPSREQVVTIRAEEATTLQALELTNGETLADILDRGARDILRGPAPGNRELTTRLYQRALGRKPNRQEIRLADELLGEPVRLAGVEDLLWTVTMLPEFQLIY